jgi:hypothetical protein
VISILSDGFADLFDEDMSFKMLEDLLRYQFYDPSALTDRMPAAEAPEDRSALWAAVNPF